MEATILDRALSDSALIEDAIAAREEAEAVEGEASPSRWREADDYVQLKERGWSTRAIAEHCGTNHSSVSRFIKCALQYSNSDSRPSFWEAFRELPGTSKEPVQFEDKTALERLEERIDKYVTKQLEAGRAADEVQAELLNAIDRALAEAVE